MAKTRHNKKDKPEAVSHNEGWHIEYVPGKGFKRISHNPRLAETHPELTNEWHPTRNGTHTPDTVTGLSTYRAWWICKYGHEWCRQVQRRAQHGSGCPHCEADSASLAVRFPKLAEEWSPKNGDLHPRNVSPSANLLAWWCCPVKDHDDYQRTVHNRTKPLSPLGCPVCEGQQPEKSQSFGTLFPALLKEWHPKLNTNLSPFHLTPGSTAKIWWRCTRNKEHVWTSPIVYRTQRNPECPFCRMWYVTDENRLSTRFPKIAAEWHPRKNRHIRPRIEGSFKTVSNLRIPAHLKDRNRPLKPSDVAINCIEIFWWKCKAGHEWQASVESRTMRGKSCPSCEETRMANEESLAARYPAVAKLWHPSRNKPVKPSDILPGSSYVAHWRCPKSATHVWEAPVHSVVRSWKGGSNGCRWCSGLSADERNSLQSKFPEVAKWWHPTKNGKLLPSDVTAKSNKRVWWHCGKPQHEFEAEICNITLAFERGANGCKFCSGRAVAPDNCLKRTFPAVAKMWHPTKNGSLSPSDVTQGSSHMAVWICENNHEWSAKVSCMVQSYRLDSATKGCPFCNGKKACSENNLLRAYPEVRKIWDSKRNENIEPEQLTPKSNKKFFWICPRERHSWQARVTNITRALDQGRIPCPLCRGR